MSPSAAQYCLLAMDLDGTLLDGEQRVSARSRAAVHRVAASGAIVALCSGRSTASMIEPQRQLGLDVHIVSYNGAIGSRLPLQANEEHVFQYNLPAEHVSTLINYAEKTERCLQFYDESFVYAKCETAEHHELVNLYQSMTGAKYKFIQNYDEVSHMRPPKILILGKDVEEVLFPDIQRLFPSHVAKVVRGDSFVEVLPVGVHKGSGLRNLCEQLRIPLPKVVACGDSWNDAEFVSMAGLGYAMKNGKDVIKGLADRVTKFPNTEDGLAIELEELLERNAFCAPPTNY